MPRLSNLAAGDLQHLDFDQHFGIGHVDRRHQLLRHPHGIRRIADDDGAGALVDKQVLRAEHALEHALHVLRHRVGEIKGVDYLLFVVLLFGRRVRIDHHHVVRHDLPRQVVLVKHQLDRLLDRHVLDEDRRLAVTLDVVIEHEIDAGLPRQHLEHHLGRRVAELQRDFRIVASLQPRCDVVGPAGSVDLGGQFMRRLETGVLLQNVAQDGIGRIVILAVERLGRVGHHGAVTAVSLEALDAMLRALVVGLDGQHTAIAGGRFIKLPIGTQGICRGDQLLHRFAAPRREVQPKGQVARILAEPRRPVCPPLLRTRRARCRRALRDAGCWRRRRRGRRTAPAAAPDGTEISFITHGQRLLDFQRQVGQQQLADLTPSTLYVLSTWSPTRTSKTRSPAMRSR